MRDVHDDKHDYHDDRNAYERSDGADPANVGSRFPHRFGRRENGALVGVCQARALRMSFGFTGSVRPS